jgi:hypothetical protein
MSTAKKKAPTTDLEAMTPQERSALWMKDRHRYRRLLAQATRKRDKREAV